MTPSRPAIAAIGFAARPPRGPARAAGAVRGGGAPAGGRRVASDRTAAWPRRSRWRGATRARRPSSRVLCVEGSRTRRSGLRPPLELLIGIQLAITTVAAAREAARSARQDRRASLRRRAACAACADSPPAACSRPRATSERPAARRRAFGAVRLPRPAVRGRVGAARARAQRWRRAAPAAAVAGGTLAITAFERLGAMRDADAAAGLLRSSAPRRTRVARGQRSADPTRDGGRSSLLAAGLLERADRRAPRNQPADRGAPRREHPLEARSAHPHRGGRVRGARGIRRTRSRIGNPTDGPGVGRDILPTGARRPDTREEEAEG